MPTSPHIYPSQRLRAIEKLIFENQVSFTKRFLLHSTLEIDLIAFGTKSIVIIAHDNERYSHWQMPFYVPVKEFTEWRDNLWREEL